MVTEQGPERSTWAPPWEADAWQQYIDLNESYKVYPPEPEPEPARRERRNRPDAMAAILDATGVEVTVWEAEPESEASRAAVEALRNPASWEFPADLDDDDAQATTERRDPDEMYTRVYKPAPREPALTQEQIRKQRRNERDRARRDRVYKARIRAGEKPRGPTPRGR